MNKVSIVIVTFNCVHDVERTLLDVLCQEYEDLELIIIDGASTDGTVDILKKYSGSYAYFVSEPDHGIYDAMNKGLMHATGEWVFFQNIGDVFDGNNILQQIFSKDWNGVDVIYGDGQTVYADGIKYEKVWTPFWNSNSKLHGMGFNHQSAFVRTKLAQQYMFDLSYKCCADYQMMVDIYKAGGTFGYIPISITVCEGRFGFSINNHLVQMKEEAKICGIEKTIYFRLKFAKEQIRSLFHRNHNYFLKIQNGIELQDAGCKYHNDVQRIAGNQGFKLIYLKTAEISTFAYLIQIAVLSLKSFFCMPSKSIILIQYPIYSNKANKSVWLLMKMFTFIKNVKFIAVIQDVEYLRGKAEKEDEIKLLNCFSGLLLQNDIMKDRLMMDGLSIPSCSIGILDYLVSNRNVLNRQLTKEICYTSTTFKEPFFEELKRLGNCGMHLFIYSDKKIESIANVSYMGTFSSNDVSNIRGSWGLVWNGMIHCHESAQEEAYYDFCSPHKASLYLVAGMPVIVKNTMAIAPIVKDFNLGICVDSLSELEETLASISDVEYFGMLSSVRQYSQRLMAGDNLKFAINQLSYVIGKS